MMLCKRLHFTAFVLTVTYFVAVLLVVVDDDVVMVIIECFLVIIVYEVFAVASVDVEVVLFCC